ncbi:MAG: hypothetical protein JXP34_12010 [Planctomycetes bacterium]|nr:hypothetical protein [Planctomycetota bacterium]
MGKTLVFAGLLLLLIALAPPAPACTTPVFRYALERWEPDLYELVVTHYGPLSEEDEGALAALWKSVEGPAIPNVTISVIDRAAGDPAPGDRGPAAPEGTEPAAADPPPGGVKAGEAASLPPVSGKAAVEEPAGGKAAEVKPGEGARVAVLYPAFLGIEEPAWEGPLRSLKPDALFDSPARKEIVRRILAGDSAVWLLLESGDKEKDEAAAKRLAAALESVKGKIEMPEAPPDMGIDPFGGMMGGPPLRMAFSMLRVSRSDPAEAMLVRSLLQSDANLKVAEDPIALPVFGRGRALCALMGEQLEEATIEEVCAFLVGWCSCEVKAQNPGIDLLISADWNGAFTGEMLREIELPSPAIAQTEPDAPPEPVPAAARETAPAAPGTPEAAPSPAAASAAPVAAPVAGPAASTDPASDPAPEDPPPANPLIRNILIAAGAVLALVMGASLAMRRRRAS